MKYTGPVFRPPLEAGTLLLQVTVGCAHNKCAFCTMYRDVRFQTEKIDQIEKDLQEARRTYGKLKRIFLVNGDAFVLSAKKLKEIAAKIIEYFPEMETITMYASIQNIMTKTDDELNELRRMRINDLYVGLETGYDEVLAKINKGHTLKDAYTQLERLNRAGISHRAMLVLGIAGMGKGIKNADETAKLLNATDPSIVWLGTLAVFDGSDMKKSMEEGTFVPATELEILEEEKRLIGLLELTDVPLYAVHPTNILPVYGYVSKDKEKMIGDIDYAIQHTDPGILNSALKRDTL